MHEPPLRGPENPLNLRNPAMPTEDTDPTPSSSPNSTDPIFPPKLGKTGPREVNVTAVQGPGVDPAPPKESTTTEQLLSGLLDAPSPDVKKKDKPRKRETSGENAADYSASPRPVPVGRKEKGEEAVIVAPNSSPSGSAGAGRANAAMGAALRARAAETLDAPGGLKGTRDDQTVPLPRKKDRRGVLAFFAALLLVGGIGWLLLGRTPTPAPSAPTKLTAQLPTATPAPTATAQAIPPPVPRPSTTAVAATATAPTASAAPPPPPTATSTGTNTSASPDFDELKKGIKH